jgi:hypothetical protein
MTKKQHADKLLRYIQSDMIAKKKIPSYVFHRSEFYGKKIKEYFEEHGDSYSSNAKEIELAENKKGNNNEKINS